jgi:hypothetical protein
MKWSIKESDGRTKDEEGRERGRWYIITLERDEKSM